MNERLNNALAALAEKLGTSVDHLWEILVRQAGIEAWVSVFQYALIMVGLLAWSRYYRRPIPEDENYDQREKRVIILTVSGCLVAIGILVAFFSLSTTVAQFANPEYWALEQILKRIGGSDG